MKVNRSSLVNSKPDLNIGLIGHVAHGKSTLAYQLTGKKTQQHSDEQEKNITINIGYANSKIYKGNDGLLHIYKSQDKTPLNEDGSSMTLVAHISIVDCPGHEAYMANMISGSAVMDACCMVIASDQSIPQPQTYEHLQAVQNANITNYIILQNKLKL